MIRASLLSVLLCFATAAGAQDDPMPVLGGHAFVPVMVMEEPFLTAQVETSVRIGQATNTNSPSFSIGDSIRFEGAPSEQVFTGLAFTYQHRMKEWLAVRVALEAAGRLGTNTRTLVVDGITGNIGYQLGWKLRVLETESWLVSGSMRLSNNAATFISPLEWANGLTGQSSTRLTRQRSSLRGAAGLHAAWGIGERFGLLASVWADYGESFTGESDNAWIGDLSVGLSYNLAKDIRIPLGLGLVTGLSGLEESTEDGAWFWSARLALQTRQDFSIGLDLGASYFDNEFHGGATQFNRVSIDMRYYY